MKERREENGGRREKRRKGGREPGTGRIPQPPLRHLAFLPPQIPTASAAQIFKRPPSNPWV